MKARVEDRHVVYKYDIEPSHMRFGKNTDVKTIRYSPAAAGVQSRFDHFPTVMHPIVYAQPETGHRVLNILPWFSAGFFELPGAEGDALLEDVVQHVVDERFACYHP